MDQIFTPVTWALAPDWLTIAEASELTGLEFSVLCFLIDDGGVDTKREGGA
jgi:hypothetical protein